VSGQDDAGSDGRYTSAVAEIERKFLVAVEPPDGGGTAERIDQGYVAIDADGTEVRVRRRSGRPLTLTMKSGDSGSTRAEEEMEIDASSFEALWALTAGRRLQKDRQLIELPGGLTAELDRYAGALQGLRVVEVEFASVADSERFRPPDWFGREITDDDRYRNRRLAVDGPPGD
jgi:CYTH domain-containing protein